MSLIIVLLVGAVSGYIASRILGGDGFGLLGNIVVGVIGGMIGNWLVKVLNVSMISGIPGDFVSAVGGAIVLLFILDFLKSRSNSSRSKRRR